MEENKNNSTVARNEDVEKTFRLILDKIDILDFYKKSGKRVVDLDYLLEDLEDFCESDDYFLNIINNEEKDTFDGQALALINIDDLSGYIKQRYGDEFRMFTIPKIFMVGNEYYE